MHAHMIDYWLSHHCHFLCLMPHKVGHHQISYSHYVNLFVRKCTILVINGQAKFNVTYHLPQNPPEKMRTTF